MKVAFLGKGGSGKSTMATALVRRWHVQGKRVLAIDADHNMDLSYNLGAEPSLFLGGDPDHIKEYAGAERSGPFSAALAKGLADGVEFTLDPRDDFTAGLTEELQSNLFLMTAGPHTQRVRSQEACSHSLAAPLKVYLPLLRLSENEVVVIDERAGTDPVATGILSGINLAVIVEEPTVNSRRVAQQIKTELELAGVPYLLVQNKIDGLAADEARMVAAIESALVPSA